MGHIAALPAKARKVSTGGNRSWSEEEETYLLRTRAQKMPYKHIAAHLKKTELACRLHFHQLSHGNHRRKRNSSVSSSNSSLSSARQSPTQYHLNNPYDPESLHGSPQDFFAAQTLGSYPAAMNSGLPSSRMQHKVLLPKPRPITPEDSPNGLSRLRINAMTGSPERSVDTDRLRQIYDSHRGHFWTAIAAEYGPNATPSQLEEIWKQAPPPMMRPPTPSESPDRNILKPSPFAPFPTLESSRDFGSFAAQAEGAVAATMPGVDSFHYQYQNPTAPPYLAPILPGQLSRSNDSWSSPAAAMHGLGMALNAHHTLQSHHAAHHHHQQTPATAITSLLTDNKCPRHGEYCVGGHCLN